MCLCDTTQAEDIHINDELVSAGFAVYKQDDYGHHFSQVCILLNPHFCYLEKHFAFSQLT